MATTGALAEAISALQRRYGTGAVRRGGDPLPAGTWGTGIPAVDALAVAGEGGLPRGRISVLAGERRGGSGATGRLTLLQALLAAASRSMQVAYVDLPGTLDPGFLADLGADLESCLVVRPPKGAPGPGLAMARALVRAGLPWVGVAFGGSRVPAAAWDHPLTALVDALWAARAVACVSAPAPLPAPLAYASSLTLACSPLGWQEAHGDVVGLRLRLEVAKSKVGAPGQATAVLVRYPRPHAVGDVVGLPSLLPGVRSGEGTGVGVPSVAGPAREDAAAQDGAVVATWPSRPSPLVQKGAVAAARPALLPEVRTDERAGVAARRAAVAAAG